VDLLSFSPEDLAAAWRQRVGGSGGLAGGGGGGAIGSRLWR
jgi:hypothetical protein